MRVVIIASGQAYQEAAAWAAPTYTLHLGRSDSVSVLVPEQELICELLENRSRDCGFSIEQFPLCRVSEKKFTSQLKCQAYCHAVSHLNREELLFLVDADTCCLGSLELPFETALEIASGKIGLVPDIADRHSQSVTEPWYLNPEERLPYVNSGVIVTSSKALPLFNAFRQFSEHEDFLRGPFNDQKVINFVLGKYFRNALVLLDTAYNQIRPPLLTTTVIAHFAGGAGYLATQRRKMAHQQMCVEVLRQSTSEKNDDAAEQLA